MFLLYDTLFVYTLKNTNYPYRACTKTRTWFNVIARYSRNFPWEAFNDEWEFTFKFLRLPRPPKVQFGIKHNIHKSTTNAWDVWGAQLNNYRSPSELW